MDNLKLNQSETKIVCGVAGCGQTAGYYVKMEKATNEGKLFFCKSCLKQLCNETKRVLKASKA